MSAPNHETMAKDVLNYLLEQNGRKFRVDTLAKTFDVSQASMKIILAKISAVESASDGHRMMFFIPSPDMIAERARVAGLPRRTHAKPYVQPKGMGERCSELYPVGRGFISIS
jgi:hypothetical protein